MSDAPLRILAVGAHPDDIEFGCGGVLVKEAARGAEITLCVCSRGESGTNGTPDERAGEAKAAADLLGATLTFIELGGDCQIEASPKNALAIAHQIRATKANVLLAPVASPNQHPDHAAVGHICRDAARLARYGGIVALGDLPPHSITHLFGYAVTPGAAPASDRPAIRVDISAHFDRWVELMECHRTQLRTRRYIELQTARARLLGIEAGVESAQALFVTDDLLIESLTEMPRSVRLF